MKHKTHMTKTGRGFKIVEFEDRYKQPCTLQESSLATEAAIWLGVNRRIDLNTGVDLPDNDNHRMHLTQDQVRALLPYLQHFVDTGSLP